MKTTFYVPFESLSRPDNRREQWRLGEREGGSTSHKDVVRTKRRVEREPELDSKGCLGGKIAARWNSSEWFGWLTGNLKTTGG